MYITLGHGSVTVGQRVAPANKFDGFNSAVSIATCQLRPATRPNPTCRLTQPVDNSDPSNELRARHLLQVRHPTDVVVVSYHHRCVKKHYYLGSARCSDQSHYILVDCNCKYSKTI